MIQLPLVFSDHMMLQREKPVCVFGTASAGKKIQVCVQNAEGTVLAGAEGVSGRDGRFEVSLPPLEPGLDRTLKIGDGEETVCISDVAVGEVWLAGGQSNMEFLMNTDAEMPAEREALSLLPEEARRALRFFDYPEIAFEGMEKLVDLSNFGKWRCLSEEDLVYFSAVSYYFQRIVAGKIGCPVGVIGCNWGGTKACCWVPEDVIREAGAEQWITEYEEGLKTIKDLTKQQEAFKKSPMNVLSDPAKPNPFDAILLPGLTHRQQEEAMKMFSANPDDVQAIGPLHPWRPAGLYHTMLEKLMPYTLRGFIWYQACSDVTHPELLAKLMQALIGKWRRDFKDESLPFLMVQIAPYGIWLGYRSERYPDVRAAQLHAADITENTYLASIGDAGMYFDIHPKHKRKPGERLGLLALKHVYGLPVSADAPRAKGLEYDGDTAVIRFEHGEGLHLTEAENGGLTEEEARRYHFSEPDQPAHMAPLENLNSLIRTVPEGETEAEIRDDSLRVRLTVGGRSVRPREIRFAWTGYYEVNVKNAAGLPVFPFVVSDEA